MNGVVKLSTRPLRDKLSARDARRSEAVAVGNLDFVEKMKAKKGGSASPTDFLDFER